MGQAGNQATSYELSLHGLVERAGQLSELLERERQVNQGLRAQIKLLDQGAYGDCPDCAGVLTPVGDVIVCVDCKQPWRTQQCIKLKRIRI